MSDWVDPEGPVLGAATSLARELADPIRLTALQLLAVEGPYTMSQLASALGISAPRLANHLARLRSRGLVAVEPRGRHAVYRLADPGVGDVLDALVRHARSRATTRRGTDRPAPSDLARTCYDHAAGRLGVAVFDTLVARGALLPPGGGGDTVAVGADPSAFIDLGVDPAAVVAGRRKLATACLDRSHRQPHLGGALGAAVLDALLDQDLVRRADGGRTLTITPAGTRRLPALLPDFTPPD